MSFEQIKGQEKPIAIIKAYIEDGRLSGGYLFTGPEGVGKKMAAKNLAKAVNCLKLALDACDSCLSCLKADKAQHPDIHVIGEDNNEEIKIEHIRELQRVINFRPYEGKKKAFIIDNAHRLTAEASNAMLKVLEEPPKNSLIILVTDKPNLLFKTVVSRCKIVKFLPLERKELEGILKEEYQLSEETAHFLSFFSEGRIGQALKLRKSEIFLEKNAVIDRFVFAKKNNLHRVQETKEELKTSLAILSTWFRDMYLVKAGMSPAEIINLDRKQDLLRTADKVSFFELGEIMDLISASVLRLEQNVNIKLLLNSLESELCKI